MIDMTASWRAWPATCWRPQAGASTATGSGSSESDEPSEESEEPEDSGL
jgi:hypothetical protein